MSKNLVIEPTANEASEIKTAIKEIIAEMKRMNRKMERDQQEIERLKAQTRATLKRLKAA